MYGRPLRKSGSSAMLSRPRSQKSWTSVRISSTGVAIVSSTESYSLMMPRFSATNARPSEAKRTVVGIVRDEKTVVSVKWGSASEPSAAAVAGWTRWATGATTTEAAARAAASQTVAARRCHEGPEDECMKLKKPRKNAATLLAVAPTVMVATGTFGG